MWSRSTWHDYDMHMRYIATPKHIGNWNVIESNVTWLIYIHALARVKKMADSCISSINVNLVILQRGCFMDNPTFYLNLCGAEAISIGRFWPNSYSLEDLMQTHRDTSRLLQPWHILFTNYLTHVPCKLPAGATFRFRCTPGLIQLLYLSMDLPWCMRVESTNWMQVTMATGSKSVMLEHENGAIVA